MFLKLFVVVLYHHAVFVKSELSTNVDELEYHYYSTPSQKEELKFKDADALNKSPLKKDVQTVIVMDGYLSNAESNMSRNTRNELLSAKGTDINVIVLNWGTLSGFGEIKNKSQYLPIYNRVLENVLPVGERVAEFIEFLKTTKNIDYSKFHIIGYSLGAHLAGVVGVFVKEKYSGTIGRITGLDPIRPFYNNQTDLRKRLDKTDATFVDVYHTNRGLLGDDTLNIGHVDIFINGGAKQPGCKDFKGYKGGVCNHNFVWKFFIKAFTTVYKACPCTGEACQCSNCTLTCTDGIRLGYDIPTSAAGDYYAEVTEAL